MIKLTFCLVRLPHLTRPQFQDYWWHHHGPLVRSVAHELQIRRYVQLHSVPEDLNAAVRASRDAPTEFDGVAMLWFDSLDAVHANGQRPEAQTAAKLLLEDEKTFIDLPKSPLWWGEEKVVVG